MDIVEQAAQVATEQAARIVDASSYVRWKHESDCRVRRAQTLPFSRVDLGGWGAIITGEDAKFGLARTFLPKTYQIGWSKRATPRVDFSGVQAGHLLQLHGNVSRSSQEDRFYRVIAIDDGAVLLQALTAAQILAIVRS